MNQPFDFDQMMAEYEQEWRKDLEMRHWFRNAPDNLRSCRTCCAVVTAPDQEAHRDWHAGRGDPVVSA